MLLLWLLTEAADVRRSLRRLEERLDSGDNVDVVDVVRKNFNELICLLDSPLFCRLLSVEDALDTLQEASRDRSFDENDFDFDLTTGELVMLESETKNFKTTSLSSDESHGHIVDGHHMLEEDKNASMLLANQHIAEVYANMSDEGFPVDMLQKLAPGCTIDSITLDKPDSVGIGLGFGIVGMWSESSELGVYIQSIQAGGVASK